MILKEGKERPKQKPKIENKENQVQIASDKVREKTTIEISIYMMHEQNEQMMHVLMHWELFNYTLKTKNWLEHRDFEQKPQNFENPTFKILAKLST